MNSNIGANPLLLHTVSANGSRGFNVSATSYFRSVNDKERMKDAGALISNLMFASVTCHQQNELKEKEGP